MKTLIILPAIFSLHILLTCEQKKESEEVPDELKPELLFNTGFEEGTQITANIEDSESFSGIDHSVPKPNDWSIFSSQSTNSVFNIFRVHFNVGNRDGRKAEIVQDPVNSANKVLYFWLKEVNSGTSGRIQADIVVRPDKGIRQLYQRVRMFVPESMQTLENYPGDFDWLIIAEFWNNIAWSNVDPEYAFRISVRLKKDKGAGNKLYFMVSTNDIPFTGEGENRVYQHNYIEWCVSNVPVPYEKWMTIEYYFQEGGYEATEKLPEGHFIMAVTPDGGERSVVCSLKTVTHSPSNPNPNGLTHWAAMKLYTSTSLVKWMKDRGLPMELYYDDLQIWQNKMPADFIK